MCCMCCRGYVEVWVLACWRVGVLTYIRCACVVVGGLVCERGTVLVCGRGCVGALLRRSESARVQTWLKLQ